MAKQLEELPADVRDSLEDGSQQIFLTALNSAMDNGMDEQSAMNVAWNSIATNYEKGSDGKWHRKGDEPGIHNKAVTSGGN